MPPKSSPDYCSAAVVFATGGAGVDFFGLLKNPRRRTGAAFESCVGRLHGETLVAVRPLREDRDFPKVLSALWAAHRPQLVLGAGLSCGRAGSCKVGEPLVAGRVAQAGSGAFTLGSAGRGGTNIRRVAFGQAATFAAAAEAEAINDWCWDLAAACVERGAPTIIASVVSELEGEAAHPGVQRVVRQSSHAGKAGALVRSLWERPSTAADLWRRRTNAWTCEGELAEVVARLLAPAAKAGPGG